MADELDPRLEARLRSVLRTEVDALPFHLHADTLEARLARHEAGRLRRRLALVAAAVVVGVGLTASLLSLGRFGGEVAASPPATLPVSPPPASAEPTGSSDAMAGCTPINQAARARVVAVSGVDSGATFGDIGLLVYERFGDTVLGSLTAWPIGELSHLGAYAPGRLSFEVGSHCVVAWEVAYAPRADVEAAIDAGGQPILEPYSGELTTDAHSARIEELPTGDLIVRLTTTWYTGDGTVAVDVRLLNFEVIEPGPVTPASTTHPDPAVPCTREDPAAAWAPAVSLYRADIELGGATYFTSSWANAGDDGVQVTPDTSLDAGDGTGLVVRVEGDVCALAWTIEFGAIPADGVGFDAIGSLAVQPNDEKDPAIARENRISLGDLPPGDWLVQASVGFANGGGIALFRVHAGQHVGD
jgi:hypothetical protein